MPIPFTASQIKAWFETADLPTQQQFADFVDTLFFMNQQAEDNATAAVATANAAAAAMPLFGVVEWGVSIAVPPYIFTDLRSVGCSVSGALSGGNYVITVTPPASWPDLYQAVHTFHQIKDNLGAVTSTTRDDWTITHYVDRIELRKAHPGSGNAFGRLYFQVFP